MDKLLTYLNSLSKDERLRFAVACGTSEGYLRKAVSVKQKLGSDLCILIDRESHGAVTCEDLRPDVDWAHIRTSTTTSPSTSATRRASDPVPESGRQGRQPLTRKNVMELSTATPPLYEKKETP